MPIRNRHSRFLRDIGKALEPVLKPVAYSGIKLAETAAVSYGLPSKIASILADSASRAVTDFDSHTFNPTFNYQPTDLAAQVRDGVGHISNKYHAYYKRLLKGIGINPLEYKAGVYPAIQPGPTTPLPAMPTTNLQQTAKVAIGATRGRKGKKEKVAVII